MFSISIHDVRGKRNKIFYFYHEKVTVQPSADADDFINLEMASAFGCKNDRKYKEKKAKQKRIVGKTAKRIKV